jgi:hypothetical protein
MSYSFVTRTSNNADFAVLTTVRVLAESPGLAVFAPARLVAHDIGLPDLSNLNGWSLFWLLVFSFFTLGLISRAVS